MPIVDSLIGVAAQSGPLNALMRLVTVLGIGTSIIIGYNFMRDLYDIVAQYKNQTFNWRAVCDMLNRISKYTPHVYVR